MYKISENLLFNFNSLSHLSLFILTLIFFPNKFAIPFFVIGHLNISFAQFFIKYKQHKYKKLSAIIGVIGHINLFIYILLLIFKLNKNSYLNYLFLIGQIGMIIFYIKHSDDLSKPIFKINKYHIQKKFPFILIFILLFIYYGLEAFNENKINRFGLILVALVYFDLCIYLIFRKY